MTLAWVGAPTQRSLFRVRDAVVGFCRSMSNLKNCLFLAIGQGSRLLVAFLLQNSAKKCFYLTLDWPTPHFPTNVSSATLGWVGYPNQRVPFRFHDGVVGFVD